VRHVVRFLSPLKLIFGTLGIPIVVCCTKIDLRGSQAEKDELARDGRDFVSSESAREFCKARKEVHYYLEVLLAFSCC